METINNLTTAARNAVWGTGESKEEPISGQTGDVSKGEPYDAGNIEHLSDTRDQSTTPHTEADTKNAETTSLPLHQKRPSPKDSFLSNEPSPPKESSLHKESSLPKESDLSPNYTAPSTNPAEKHDSSAVPGDHSQAQNDIRDPSHASAHPDAAAAKKNVDDTQGFDNGDNPTKVDGPGQRPLEQVAKEHGGNAGTSGSSSNGLGDKKEEGTGSGEQASGIPKKDEGTGELYVRSSGLTADGGDFDAAKPGAGRKADRLLEHKGVHRDGPNGGIVGEGADMDGHADGKGGKHKTSLKDKIKAKLHKN